MRLFVTGTPDGAKSVFADFEHGQPSLSPTLNASDVERSSAFLTEHISRLRLDSGSEVFTYRYDYLCGQLTHWYGVFVSMRGIRDDRGGQYLGLLMTSSRKFELSDVFPALSDGLQEVREATTRDGRFLRMLDAGEITRFRFCTKIALDLRASLHGAMSSSVGIKRRFAFLLSDAYPFLNADELSKTHKLSSVGTYCLFCTSDTTFDHLASSRSQFQVVRPQQVARVAPLDFEALPDPEHTHASNFDVRPIVTPSIQRAEPQVPPAKLSPQVRDISGPLPERAATSFLQNVTTTLIAFFAGGLVAFGTLKAIDRGIAGAATARESEFQDSLRKRAREVEVLKERVVELEKKLRASELSNNSSPGGVQIGGENAAKRAVSEAKSEKKQETKSKTKTEAKKGDVKQKKLTVLPVNPVPAAAVGNLTQEAIVSPQTGTSTPSSSTVPAPVAAPLPTPTSTPVAPPPLTPIIPAAPNPTSN